MARGKGDPRSGALAAGIWPVSSRGMPARREYLCYTDGACKAAHGGAGGWGFHVIPPEGPPIERYGSEVGTSSKAMEYRAVAEALAALPDGVAATVCSDDRTLIDNLDRRLVSYRAAGFRNVDAAIVDSVRRIGDGIADRALVVRWQWVRAHAGNVGNERADALAAQGAREAKAAVGPRRRSPL